MLGTSCFVDLAGFCTDFCDGFCLEGLTVNKAHTYIISVQEKTRFCEIILLHSDIVN